MPDEFNPHQQSGSGTPQVPAAWYPDPEVPGQMRYWDGSSWTQHRAQATSQSAPAQQEPSPQPVAAPTSVGPTSSEAPPAAQAAAVAPASPQPAVQTGAGAEGYAVKTPMGRAILFSIFSFGIWTFYWFYVNRKRVDAELGQGRDDATMHTLGLIVPVLNFFIIYWLWRDINLLRGRVGLAEMPVTVYLVLTIVGLGVISYVLVLNQYNEYWDRRSDGRATDAPVAGGEKVAVAIGVGLFLLWLLIIIIAAAAGGGSSTS